MKTTIEWAVFQVDDNIKGRGKLTIRRPGNGMDIDTALKYGLPLENFKVISSSEVAWSDVLERARAVPKLYIGDPALAHLRAVCGAIQFVCEARPFGNPVEIYLVATPTQYAVCCRTDEAGEHAESPIDWTGGRMLFDLLGDPYFYGLNGIPVGNGAAPVVLAERFFIGIGTHNNFWYQTYEHGWPVSPVKALDRKPLLQYVVAGKLSEPRFPGLPFTPEQICQHYPRVRTPSCLSSVARI